IPANTLLLSGKIASRPASPPTLRFPPLAPNIVGLSIMPPLAYQFIPTFGTLGGIKLNLPDKLKCGNLGILIFGRLSFIPLKKPLILSTISLILSLAFIIGDIILFLTSVNLLDADVTI